MFATFWTAKYDAQQGIFDKFRCLKMWSNTTCILSVWYIFFLWRSKIRKICWSHVRSDIQTSSWWWFPVFKLDKFLMGLRKLIARLFCLSHLSRQPIGKVYFPRLILESHKFCIWQRKWCPKTHMKTWSTTAQPYANVVQKFEQNYLLDCFSFNKWTWRIYLLSSS